MKRFKDISGYVDDPAISASPLTGRDGGLFDRQTHISCRFKVVSGVDTLKLSLWLGAGGSGKKFLARLDMQKKLCQMGDNLSVAVDFANDVWELRRTGVKNYNYVLCRGDVMIMFNNRAHDGKIPNCSVSVGSISCWSSGYYTKYNEIMADLRQVGFVIKKHIISRIDMACDIIGYQMSNTGLDNRRRNLTEARSYSVYYSGDNLTGIMAGKGDIVLRVYDKTREMKQKKATEKQILMSYIWGEGCGSVTRVEFQLRRKFLKNIESNNGITTVEDFKKRQQEVWNYCINWFRQCDRDIDRKNKNQKRGKISPFWKILKITESKEKVKRVHHVGCVNIDSLMEQGVGCILSAVAGIGTFFVNKKTGEVQKKLIIDQAISLLRGYATKAFDVEKYKIKLARGARENGNWNVYQRNCIVSQCI